MGRLPVVTDFPSKIKLTVVPPPNDNAPTNVLILLHGLGDKHDSFTKLGQQMNLPETACISLQGPQNLLDLEGFHWGDDIIFDSNNGGLDADAGFKQCTVLLKIVVQEVLLAKCGYDLREVMVFGFGQGGMAGLSLGGGFEMPPLHIALHQDSPNHELGGIMSIGAPLPSETPASLDPKCKTPVLVCAGSDQSSVTPGAEDKLKRCFEFVEVKRYRRPGDGMPSNRDEMMPIMQFFSRRLRSVKGVPEGSVEIS